jgi:PAS domain S-box-containing protein
VIRSRRPSRADDELRVRVRQGEAAARFGHRALAGMEVDQLLAEAVRIVAEELRVDFVAVLKLEADGDTFTRRASLGLPAEPPEDASPASAETMAGYTLRAQRPVVAEDLREETRFRPSPSLEALGVVSSMAATISGRERPFGVIGAHSVRAHHFSGDDAHFLQAIANVIGAAVERDRVETLLRDSEARFRELANTTPALMWMTDAEGRVAFVNDAWLRFTGRTLEEERGDTFAMSAHPDDRAALLERWRAAVARRGEFRAEYRLCGADGEYRWMLEVGVPRYAAGEFAGYVGTATDINERKTMETALRASEARFREMADAAPVMIWTTDERGRVTFVNRGWLRFTGTTLQEELGESWALGVHPEDVAEMLSSWDEALTRGEPWAREYRLRRRDGEYRWIVDRGVPRFEDGRLVGYVGSATDIHERKTMEVSLRRVYEQEHRIAETLQRSLLPEKLPEIEGLELAARYLPASSETAIGGDWYDAMELPDGRVALVVGDVVGHGLRAAAVMGQLRTAFRAYSQVETSPADVVARLNRLVMAGGEEAMATVLYLVLDRDTGELAFTNAGHPPPLVLEPGGPRFLEGGRSVPVGATEAAAFREGVDAMPPGSTLLLYTDGLVERRDVPLEDRLARLAAVAGAAGGEVEDVCGRVVEGVLGAAETGDDVALLAVRPLPIALPVVELSLPAEPEALSGLRRRLGRFLHASGASEDEVYEITLAISEAAGNSIEHAYGPEDATFEVRVAVAGGEITAEVRDRGAWRDPRGESRGRGLRIIEGLMDDVQVSSERGTVVRMRRRLSARVAA